MTETDVIPHPRKHGRMIGHASVLSALADSASRMPNGILLYGDRGIGKATIAYRLARFLLGASAPEEGSEIPFAFSMDDPVCQRIRAGSCGDLHVLEPMREKSAKLEAISVRAVRKAGEFLQLTSSDSGKKCVIIDAVDDMNVNAQNALLKMLEEPAGNTTLILIAHCAGAALPTVRSRCRAIYVPHLSGGEALSVVTSLFSGVSRDDIEAACRAAEGSPGRAAAFIQSGAVQQFYLAKDALVAAAQGNRAEAERAIERLNFPSGDDHVWRHLLFMLSRFLCDASASEQILPLHTATRYYEALSRLSRLADAVYLDKKTVLLNVMR